MLDRKHDARHPDRPPRFDANTHCDRESLRIMMDEADGACCYCARQVQFDSPGLPAFATLERWDNDLGHSRANCRLACARCNLRHHAPGVWRAEDGQEEP